MDKYLVKSTKWSEHYKETMWWGPNSSGYTPLINRAGIYTEEEAKRLENTHGSHVCVAVKFDKELFEKGLEEIQEEIQFHEKEKERYKGYIADRERKIVKTQEMLEKYIETMSIK